MFFSCLYKSCLNSSSCCWQGGRRGGKVQRTTHSLKKSDKVPKDHKVHISQISQLTRIWQNWTRASWIVCFCLYQYHQWASRRSGFPSHRRNHRWRGSRRRSSVPPSDRRLDCRSGTKRPSFPVWSPGGRPFLPLEQWGQCLTRPGEDREELVRPKLEMLALKGRTVSRRSYVWSEMNNVIKISKWNHFAS